MKRIVISALLCVLALPAFAQQATASNQITNLDDLLAKVRADQEHERQLNQQREQAFIAERNQQRALLDKARAEYAQAQQKNSPMRAQAEANDAELTKLRQQLQKSVADVGDIYTVYQRFASDFSTVLNESQTTAQFPQRVAELKAINTPDKLPSLDDMQKLWYLVQQEMTEASKISHYDGRVIAKDGTATAMPVVRVGTFMAFTDGIFLRYVPDTGELVMPSRQPQDSYGKIAKSFGESKDIIAPIVIDPTRGSLLGILALTPDIPERIKQGGSVGYMTITIGIIGLIITLWRTGYLLAVQRRVNQQLNNLNQPNNNNPLGRIMLSVKNIAPDDEETVQYKLDEAVLKEIPRLERMHTVIKLFAAVAPMLGLLGTVTGMIKTFEMISLFGGGDPKLMSAGISEALVNTVLGIAVAVPLLFGHNLVTALARNLITRLDEQSAGILARNMEKAGPHAHERK